MRIFLCILFLFVNGLVEAQRINFSTYVQDETIFLNVVTNPLGLNFNSAEQIIVTGQLNPVVVDINNNATVVIEIDAPIEYDITAELSWSPGLSYLGLDTGITVPFNFQFAYNNTGELTDMQRRATAVEVPAMFNTVTFPVRRRVAGGPPLPPPTPDHDGFVRQRSKAYLFLYGSLGPIPSNIRSGNYSGTINLNISYNDNTF